MKYHVLRYNIRKEERNEGKESHPVYTEHGGNPEIQDNQGAAGYLQHYAYIQCVPTGAKNRRRVHLAV